MAVKQNNTDSSANDGNQSTMNLNENDCGTKPKINMNSSKAEMDSSIGDKTETDSNTLTKICGCIQVLDSLRNEKPDVNFNNVYTKLILELSQVETRAIGSNLKQFKENIAKVYAFFEKDKSSYLFYLKVVCHLITQYEGPPDPSPSPAISIFFQLFPSEVIYDSVRKLMECHKHIHQTVQLLVRWISFNLCPNHICICIMAILKWLYEQEKYDVLNEIAVDNIEHLFAMLILPAFRPKVAPLVFFMLQPNSVPQVFEKILPKFLNLYKNLKKQCSANNENADETGYIMNQLLELACIHFHRNYRKYVLLYQPVDHILKEYRQASDSEISILDEQLLYNTNNVKVGLVNLGNTCFFNSVLQALAATKGFSREILLSSNKSPLLIKMQQQIALMLYSTRNELTPTRILNATRPPGFKPGLQQDSSEFLGYLLELLHEQEVLFHKKFIAANPEIKQGGDNVHINEVPYQEQASALDVYTFPNDSTASNNNKDGAMMCCSSVGNQGDVNGEGMHNKGHHTNVVNLSTIEKTFTGKLQTTYKCLACGWESRNVDSFRDLQLSFPELKSECASNYSVQDLIEYYCSPEKLDGDNQYFCEQCKKLCDADKKVSFLRPPKNLILTLKHFKYDQKYHMRAKLMHKVFHDEKVSVRVCFQDSLAEMATVHYDLYAGIIHSGFSMDSGHYFTYASDANEWFKFNDSIVTVSQPEELHNLTPPNTPYILFYQMSSRTNEGGPNSSTATTFNVDVPDPLTIDELPQELREFLSHDNCVFNEEVQIRRLKNNNSGYVYKCDSKGSGNYRSGDDDDEDQPSGGSCRGNATNFVNRFVC